MNNTLPRSFWYDTLDSTMNEAKRLLKSGEIKNTSFIVANCQTKGRGTRGKIWSSPKGGIYLSIVHLPEERKYFETTTIYTLACGVACAEAIKEITNIHVSLKPVNDIYADGKKLGGILVEGKLSSTGISSLITGVGINVYKVKHKLDQEKVLPVSIEELLPEKEFEKLETKKLIKKIVLKVCFWYSLVFKGKDDTVVQAWQSLSIQNL